MTDKRFTMCHEQNDINGWTMSIVDWQTKQPFDYTTYEVHSSSITDTKDEMEDLCLLLNELAEENQDLHKKEVELGQNYLRLLEENEQLKQQDKINEDCYKKLLQKYDDLKKENEQLKKALWCIRKRYGYTVEEFIEDLKDNGTDLTKVDLE